MNGNSRALAIAIALLVGVAAASSSGSAVAANPPAPDLTPPAAEPKKPANTLRWTTASEVDNFGFDVYRADKEEGPFERITEKPIPGAGTTDVPTRYAWADDKIDPTREYWYWVESISMSGHREAFTPVIRAPAKIAPAAPKPLENAR